MSPSVLAYNMKRMIQIMGIPMLIQAIGPDSFIPPRRYRHVTAVMKTRFTQPLPISDIYLHNVGPDRFGNQMPEPSCPSWSGDFNLEAF